MSCLIARTGRHRQRYTDGLRLVAGCIPYRIERNSVEAQSCNVENRILVLMISTPNRDDLVFPKGGWEDDETITEAVHREALEEAGLKGTLGESPIGVWEFRSKSRETSCSLEGGCRGYMFAMEVTEELELWPEKYKYDRKWLSPEEAFKLCRYDWMRDALNKFLTALSKDLTKWTGEPLVEAPIGSDRKLFSPGCSGEKPSSVQTLEESCQKSAVQV